MARERTWHWGILLNTQEGWCMLLDCSTWVYNQYSYEWRSYISVSVIHHTQNWRWVWVAGACQTADSLGTPDTNLSGRRTLKARRALTSKLASPPFPCIVMSRALLTNLPKTWLSGGCMVQESSKAGQASMSSHSHNVKTSGKFNTDSAKLRTNLVINLETYPWLPIHVRNSTINWSVVLPYIEGPQIQ